MEAAKLFISHASEDKEDFVEPLAHALRDAGFEVWYDKFVLTMGDSLLRKISEGLNQADFGIVVLSKHFFTKKWPQAELDGLFSLETVERKVVLPIWKDVTEADVKAFSPILASKLAAMASHGVPAVVDEIKRAVDTTRTVEKFSAIENVFSRFRSLDQRVSGAKRAQQLASSEEGVQIVRKAVESAVATLKSKLDEFGKSSESVKFHLDTKNWNAISARCPYRIEMVVSYQNQFTNSLTAAVLHFIIFYREDEWLNGQRLEDAVRKFRFQPSFDHTLKLVWGCDEQSFTTEQLIAFVLKELAEEIEERHAEAEAKKQL